jgi:subtilase family serine protease
VIENDGTAEAKDFQVAFIVDGEFIEGHRVRELTHVKGYNTIEVTAKWKPGLEGAHTLKVIADGPLPYVVELDKTDNEKEIKIKDLRLRYPDLWVESVALESEAGSVEQGQPVVVNVTVASAEYAKVNRGFDVTVYADDYYIGSGRIEGIEKGERAFAAIPWNRPVKGVENIHVVIDERNEVREQNETNNLYVHELEAPLNVKLPNLVIESIYTRPESGMASYGDLLETAVTLKNVGEVAINKPFVTVLYVNGRKAGEFVTDSSLLPGTSVTGIIEWKAIYLPTAPHYELSVYADAYSSLYLADRSGASKTVQYSVKGELQVDYTIEKEAYTVNEKPCLKQKWYLPTSPQGLWVRRRISALSF